MAKHADDLRYGFANLRPLRERPEDILRDGERTREDIVRELKELPE